MVIKQLIITQVSLCGIDKSGRASSTKVPRDSSRDVYWTRVFDFIPILNDDFIIIIII